MVLNNTGLGLDHAETLELPAAKPPEDWVHREELFDGVHVVLLVGRAVRNEEVRLGVIDNLLGVLGKHLGGRVPLVKVDDLVRAKPHGLRDRRERGREAGHLENSGHTCARM